MTWIISKLFTNEDLTKLYQLTEEGNEQEWWKESVFKQNDLNIKESTVVFRRIYKTLRYFLGGRDA